MTILRQSITLRQVAESAGVSPGTVSRALSPNTRGLVKPETARRVDAAVRRLGYQPNSAARSLRTRRSYSIGVVIPDFTNPLFPRMVRGIEDTLGTMGYSALVVNTDSDNEHERRLFEVLQGRQVDGFILATATRHDGLITSSLNEDVPVVLMNRTVDEKGVFAVVPDDRGGIDQVVDHLYQLGHRAIGCIAGPQEVSTGYLRYRAFIEAMTARGISVEDRAVVFSASYSESAGSDAARSLLTSWPECTALIAANDMVALGIYDVARELGLNRPRELSVVGFNDLPFADRFAPPLTTVHIPVYDIGVGAADLLLERLGTESAAPRTMVLDAHLVVRGSTAPPRSA